MAPQRTWSPIDDALPDEEGVFLDEGETHSPDMSEMYPAWHAKANCLGKVEDADQNFYGIDEIGIRPSLSSRQIKEARKLCQACPVARECITDALTRREKYGVWGGTTGRFRAQLYILIDEGYMTLAAAIEEAALRLREDLNAEDL